MAHAVPKPSSALPPPLLTRLSFSGTWCPCAEAQSHALSPVSLSPRLSHILSPYLLPASAVAPSVPFSLAQTQPDPAAAPPRATAPLGLPLSLAASGRPCHRPSPGPALSRFLAARAEEAPGGDALGASPPPSRRRRRLGPSGGQGGGGPASRAPASPPPALARRALGRMGCTVSLVCCEALEPGAPCGPQPSGSPPAPVQADGWESRGWAHAERSRLLLQVGRCGGRWWAHSSSLGRWWAETGKEPRQESACRQLSQVSGLGQYQVEGHQVRLRSHLSLLHSREDVGLDP